MDEEVFFDVDDTQITTSRVIIGNKTYQLSNISSCEFENIFIDNTNYDRRDTFRKVMTWVIFFVSAGVLVRFDMLGELSGLLTKLTEFSDENLIWHIIDATVLFLGSWFAAAVLSEKLVPDKCTIWYAVKTISAGDETQIVRSLNKDRIERIYDAITKAMAARSQS